jgi:hypothetical protein
MESPLIGRQKAAAAKTFAQFLFRQLGKEHGVYFARTLTNTGQRYPTYQEIRVTFLLNCCRQ